MEGEIIKEALLETGWQSTFAFPTASKENIKLLELVSHIKLKSAPLSLALLRLKIVCDKCWHLDKHLKGKLFLVSYSAIQIQPLPRFSSLKLAIF